MEEDVINTPHVFRGTRQVTMEPEGSVTTLSKNFHEKDRFVFGVDLYGHSTTLVMLTSLCIGDARPCASPALSPGATER